ncbi:TonB family protein [Jannaschia sp. 2305UL9-9]|uniref:cell envelope integrity protein TolA n=1 Tax=Jannaschia sp. 2305UL9-9 TaxID=3121638 RepID=UPI00352922AB
MSAHLVPRSLLIGVVALVVSGVVHLGGVVLGTERETVQIKGGSGSGMPMNGTAFADMVVGIDGPVEGDAADPVPVIETSETPEVEPEVPVQPDASPAVTTPTADTPDTGRAEAPGAALAETAPTDAAPRPEVARAEDASTADAAPSVADVSVAPTPEATAQASALAADPAPTATAPEIAAAVQASAVSSVAVATAQSAAADTLQPVARGATPPTVELTSPVTPQPEIVEPVSPPSTVATAPVTADIVEPLPEAMQDGIVVRSARPTTRPQSVERRAAEVERTREAERERQTRQAAPAPERGNAQTNQRAGSQQRGTGQTRQSGQGRAQQAGNAAVSNYPGVIASCVSRAATRARGGRGSVRISFSVNGSGRVGGVSASGDPGLARAVTRAIQGARCPPPPPGARTSFTLPVRR